MLAQILLPFTSSSMGDREVVAVVEVDDFCCMERLTHLCERYDFRAGIHVDRESLLQKRKAEIVVRPQLLLRGMPVPLSLLQSLDLSITSVDLAGIGSTRAVPLDFGDAERVSDGRVDLIPASAALRCAGACVCVPAGGGGARVRSPREPRLAQPDRDLHGCGGMCARA